MSESYEIEVNTHPSIYTQGNNEDLNRRKLKVYFSIPDGGVNEDTGLLLLIAGYGGQATSNVYKKMRDQFSDEYNLVTIQCNYFGYEFMQDYDKIYTPRLAKDELKQIFTKEELENIYKDGKFDFTIFLVLGSKYNLRIKVQTDLSEENPNYFNDMGILQAIDNIVAVLSVMNILFDNDCSFNTKKVLMYGHSQGAYLAHLCNAFAPTLFSLIIDNSAWLYPRYLTDTRELPYMMGKLTYIQSFDYLARKIIYDKEILNLNFLYSNFVNYCNIISYHGVTDELCSCNDKRKLCQLINKCIYKEISQNEVDNIIFKSTNHGLDADFLELFHYTMQEYNIQFEKDTHLLLKNASFKTSKHEYLISYANVMPEITLG